MLPNHESHCYNEFASHDDRELPSLYSTPMRRSYLRSPPSPPPSPLKSTKTRSPPLSHAPTRKETGLFAHHTIRREPIFPELEEATVHSTFSHPVPQVLEKSPELLSPLCNHSPDAPASPVVGPLTAPRPSSDILSPPSFIDITSRLAPLLEEISDVRTMSFEGVTAEVFEELQAASAAGNLPGWDHLMLV